MPSAQRDLWAGLWEEVDRIQDEMTRLFGGRFANGRGPSAAGPRVNVWEDDQNVYVETDLPGVPLDKLEIFIKEGNQLTIQGERPSPEFEGAVWHRQERPWGQFTRAVTLPVLVDADKVDARLEQGVLRLTLPKSEAAKPRKIQVKGS
ncbi:MAG TPA: Hsp20/alpha crystallin family protein [Gemmataceae bacterium]